MSRTYRKMHSGRRYTHKWYRADYYRTDDSHLSNEQVRALFLATRHLPKLGLVRVDYAEANPDWDLPARYDHLHHYVFRNGSCRRQRKNGTRKTKQLWRQVERHRFKEELRKTVAEGYDNRVRYGPAYLHGQVKKTS